MNEERQYRHAYAPRVMPIHANAILMHDRAHTSLWIQQEEDHQGHGHDGQDGRHPESPAPAAGGVGHAGTHDVAETAASKYKCILLYSPTPSRLPAQGNGKVEDGQGGRPLLLRVEVCEDGGRHGRKPALADPDESAHHQQRPVRLK